MQTALLIVILVASGLLFIVTGYIGIVGFVTAFTGARWEQCPRCRHYVLTVGAGPHASGCPSGPVRASIHALAMWPARHPHPRAH